MDLNFYKGKRIFVTGHTGFKGSWLCKILIGAKADVTGFSLPPTTPSLFEIAGISKGMTSVFGDIRDLNVLKDAFDKACPEIVFHLAAQPLVLRSYEEPHYTYETNVMGTVNILECIRQSTCVKSFLNVTTDKVYENNEWEWGYREKDPLDGYDPYSNSKSCSELVTHCYKRSFFAESKVAVSTARAGNVIGGGDFANDRIIPECIKAAIDSRDITVRNPGSIRPYQYVLDALYAYLLIASEQYKNEGYADYYNVGPDGCEYSTGDLVDLFCSLWGDNIKWFSKEENTPHEVNSLKLDNSKLKAVFGWKPRVSIETALIKTIEMTKCWISGGDVSVCMDNQIDEYYNI